MGDDAAEHSVASESEGEIKNLYGEVILCDNAKIDRLHAISFYTMMPNKKIKGVFGVFYEAEYRKTRKQWRSWITAGIAEAQKLADAYFDAVYMLVFDGKGKLAYPSRLKF